MSELTEKHCIPCEGGVPTLDANAIDHHLQQCEGWELAENGKSIIRKLEFKNFYRTIGFVNTIAFIANQEGHHPDLAVGYNYCHITFMTHAVDGLTENDFICAAKVNAVLDLGK